MKGKKIVDQLEISERNEKLHNHILTLTKAENWHSSLHLTNESLKQFEHEEWLSNVDTVYLVGHGTSLASALVAEAWFAHISKTFVKAVPAFQFKNHTEDFLINPQNTLVIGVSCSGNTQSVVNSLEKANALGAITLCLSGTQDMACAKVADYRIKTDAYKDATAKLGAYTVSHIYILLGAFQLAVLLGSKNGNIDAAQVMYWQEQLEEVISAGKCLPDLSRQMEKISRSMAETAGNEFVVLGTGPNYGTMKEGALKVSELCWLFGAGEELEDFAHGRFREVDDKTPLMIISPTGSTYEKTMDLLAGCSTSKTPTVVVTGNKTKAMEKLATYVVEMPKIKDEYLTPLIYIFPFWFYGFHIRQLAGGLAGEVRHSLMAVDINFRAHFNELGEKI